MHVIVVGCGRLGSELAIELDAQGHSVAIIDKARRGFQRYLPDRFSGRAVVGFGFDRDSLEQADIKHADAVAAVTGGDNSNIMTARIARETYEVPNVVARIQDPRRAAIYQRLGIATVASVAWATDQVMRRLDPDAHTVEWTDANGALSMLEVSLPAAWAGQKLAALSVGDRHRVVAISRGGAGRLATEEAIGQEGDVLHLMVQRDARAELDTLLEHGPDGGHH
ncbi:MAG TPA: TrkA family potassium uptake protein [Acidimicrobiales bacterium]|nr:TrkA family potassium uptake protein [Acidimicrobiales bacterium]